MAPAIDKDNAESNEVYIFHPERFHPREQASESPHQKAQRELNQRLEAGGLDGGSEASSSPELQ